MSEVGFCSDLIGKTDMSVMSCSRLHHIMICLELWCSTWPYDITIQIKCRQTPLFKQRKLNQLPDHSCNWNSLRSYSHSPNRPSLQDLTVCREHPTLKRAFRTFSNVHLLVIPFYTLLLGIALVLFKLVSYTIIMSSNHHFYTGPTWNRPNDGILSYWILWGVLILSIKSSLIKMANFSQYGRA